MCYVKSEKQIGFKVDFLRKIIDDSAWFCVEKLKKHGFDIKRFRKLLNIPQESKRIHEIIVLIGAFNLRGLAPCLKLQSEIWGLSERITV